MHLDTQAIRVLARTFREQGDRVRAEADTLSRLTRTVPWTGLAADAMRQATRIHGAHLRNTADLQDRAAVALDRHADAVDHVAGMVDDAVDAVGDAVRDLAHAVPGLS